MGRGQWGENCHLCALNSPLLKPAGGGWEGVGATPLFSYLPQHYVQEITRRLDDSNANCFCLLSVEAVFIPPCGPQARPQDWSLELPISHINNWGQFQEEEEPEWDSPLLPSQHTHQSECRGSDVCLQGMSFPIISVPLSPWIPDP